MRVMESLEIYEHALDLSVDIEAALRGSVVRATHANQLRRSSCSIADNIAEGCAYESDKVMRRHLRIALGSTLEAQTQVRRLLRIEDLKPEYRSLEGRLGSLRRQIAAFIRWLEK